MIDARHAKVPIQTDTIVMVDVSVGYSLSYMQFDEMNEMYTKARPTSARVRAKRRRLSFDSALISIFLRYFCNCVSSFDM